MRQCELGQFVPGPAALRHGNDQHVHELWLAQGPDPTNTDKQATKQATKAGAKAAKAEAKAEAKAVKKAEKKAAKGK